MSDSELAERINELVTPTATDVRRTKRAMLRLLADQAPHFAAHLVGDAATAVDAPRQLERLELHFDGLPDPALIRADDPAILYVHGRIAAMRGLGELAVSGNVIPAFPPENGEDRDDTLLFSAQVQSDTLMSKMETEFVRLGVRAFGREGWSRPRPS